jgi:hypothetical protein
LSRLHGEGEKTRREMRERWRLESKGLGGILKVLYERDVKRCGCERDWRETEIQHFRCVCPSQFLLRCRRRKQSFLIGYREETGKLEAINQGAQNRRPGGRQVIPRFQSWVRIPHIFICCAQWGQPSYHGVWRRAWRRVASPRVNMESGDGSTSLVVTKKKNSSFLSKPGSKLSQRIGGDSSRTY